VRSRRVEARSAGIILAGGQSLRMGRDKAELRIGDQTILEGSIEVLLEVAEEVLVVGRPVVTSSLNRAIRAVPDDVPNAGPLGGLVSGLRQIESPYAIVVACDHPFLDARLLRYLLGLASGYDAVVPVIEGRSQPTHAVYARHIQSAGEQQLASGRYKLDLLLGSLQVRWVSEEEIDAAGLDRRSFVNVNTPPEWEMAQRAVPAWRTDGTQSATSKVYGPEEHPCGTHSRSQPSAE
jgi:molybdopterin-guanine dinucleotide biosynthesis protein A